MTSQMERRVVPTPQKLVCSPIRHRTSSDLQFWYDHEKNIIATEDPEICLHFLRTTGLDAVMHVCLRMKGLRIQVMHKDDQPFPVSVYRGPKFETVWEIGSLGVPLYLNNATGSYTAGYKTYLDLQPIAVDRTFSSREQQDYALLLVSEMLSKYCCEWIGACRGEEQHATVVIDPSLDALLKSGELIK